MDKDPELAKKLFEVRRDSWVAGMKGLFYGGVVGFVGYKIVDHYPALRKQFQINRNSYIMFIFIGSAIGSYLGSITGGKNSLADYTPLLKNAPIVSPELIKANNIQSDVSPYQNHDHAFYRRAEAIRAHNLKKQMETDPYAIPSNSNDSDKFHSN